MASLHSKRVSAFHRVYLLLVQSKCNGRTCFLLSVSIIAFVFLINRSISYNLNVKQLVPAPINHIERVCPPPFYPVIGSDNHSNRNATPRICITTLTDSAKADFIQRLVRWRNFNNLLELTWPNKQDYCKKHGYHLYNESDSLDPSRPPSWSKIRAARRLLLEESCDWVFWMDADTVIMNSAKRIEDFLPLPESGIDLVLTRQKGNSWNAGAWLIRNSTWSLNFLDHWWNMEEYVKPKGLAVSGDNDALRAYLLSMEEATFKQHIVVPERCTFNSDAKWTSPAEAAALTAETIPQQPWYMSTQGYHKGDLVAHVAGTFRS
jgi:galactosyl transferase GMA12/MNN10 family